MELITSAIGLIIVCMIALLLRRRFLIRKELEREEQLRKAEACKAEAQKIKKEIFGEKCLDKD